MCAIVKRRDMAFAACFSDHGGWRAREGKGRVREGKGGQGREREGTQRHMVRRGMGGYGRITEGMGG